MSSGQTFATKADAHAHLSSLEADINRGTVIDPQVGRVQFGNYARTWLVQRDLRPRTRETYESQLRWILGTFEGALLNEITPGDVRAWHGELVHSTLHPNSVSKVYRMLRTILSTAVDDGLIRSNPAHVKGAARESMVERPLLTWEQVAALASTIEPRFSALVWLAAATGLRFGELAGLTVDDVDLVDASVRVRQALGFERGKGATLGAPKTESSYRTVSLPDPIVDRMSAHMSTYPAAPVGAPMVFTSVKGSPLLNRYFAPYWRKARGSVGLDDVRFHDLRHLAGTEAASAGASLREVMARMGHSTSDASLRYLKASESRDREIGTAIAQRIEASQTTRR